MLVSNTTLKKGIVKVTKRKGPIVVLEDNELSLVFNSHSKIENNDIVLVEPYYKSGKAQVVKILKRRNNYYTGEVIKDGKYYKVVADKHEDIILKKPMAIGMIVLVDDNSKMIKDVIGHKDDSDIRTKKILLENEFSIRYSNEYLEELKNIPDYLDDELIKL